MTKTQTIQFADLFPGEGGRGVKSGIPRFKDTKLSGTKIVNKLLEGGKPVELRHADIVKVARERLVAYGEANGVTVEATDEQLLEWALRNVTAAVRGAAVRKEAAVTVRTNVVNKRSGVGRLVVEAKG